MARAKETEPDAPCASSPAMDEVREIISLGLPGFDFSRILDVYQDVVSLFEGRFQGYRKCNTRYHDLKHTEDCVKEVAKLIHGALVSGCTFSPRGINLALIAALLHDTGYIQKSGDRRGTGARYTLVHVRRSIEFTRNYFLEKGFSREDFLFVRNCLKCTGLDVQISQVRFLSEENELLGKILGAGDLLGQMSDPHYLEKLPYLFEEFQEGKVPGFASEWELLRKTPDFWEFTQRRFATEFSGVDRFLKHHFRARYGIEEDLDRLAIENNIRRLKYLLEHHPLDYREHLAAVDVPGPPVQGK